MNRAKQRIWSEAKNLANNRKTQASESLEGLARALRNTGQQFQQENKPGLAHYSDQAAGKVENLSQYLRNTDVEDLLRSAEGLARRQPVMVIAGAFIAGIFLARMLRSSVQ
ncbi:MAG: hypothetical protein ABFD62_11730 [Syntrophaceae bacterium]